MPKITGKRKEDEKRFVFTQQTLDDIFEKINKSIPLKNHEKPWFKNQPGLKKPNIKWGWTEEEQYEYYKCATDIFYFAEKYCKIKSEDGKIKPIKLRDYQNDMLELMSGSRSILNCSRQVGKCKSLITKSLYKINNKIIELPAFKLLFKYKENKTIYDYIKYPIYSLLNILS